MKYKMEQLINRSYEAIKARGLITDYTPDLEFRNKMIEEWQECVCAGNIGDKESYISEVTDLATVCIMQIHHLGYNFINEFEKVVEKNEIRANKTSR